MNVDATKQATALATVAGQTWQQLPLDLYIPPHALRVFLEEFEGPLDLLLYLIRRQNLNILDIPLAEVTRQYMEYLNLMQELELELAAEYLLMGAWLAEIKSRLLLPQPATESGAELDPRAELVRRLQEYERVQQASRYLDELPRMERDIFTASAAVQQHTMRRYQPPVNLEDLLEAMRDLMERAALFEHHHIIAEGLSVRERMAQILERVDADNFTAFTQLFSAQEGRRGLVVTLIAVLELLREALLELVQVEAFADIQVRRVS